MFGNVKNEAPTNNNAVYETLLREYTRARQADLEKTATAREKIEEADKAIEANNRLMEEATAAGDMPTYTALKIETTKAEEVKKFYKQVLAKAESTPCIAPEAALALYHEADKEIAALRQEYNKAMVEALKPLIELSNDTWLKIYLLQYAKNRIESNLEHKPSGFCANPAYGMDIMQTLDKVLQSAEYKKASPDVSAEIKRDLYERYEWHAPANAIFKEEAARWI